MRSPVLIKERTKEDKMDMENLKEELKNEINGMKITDEELESVNGGFKETASLPTKGMNIKCPVCGNSKNFGNALFDQKVGSVEYHCNDCGQDFVCYERQVILKNNWIGLCNKKNYSYPFA